MNATLPERCHRPDKRTTVPEDRSSLWRACEQGVWGKDIETGSGAAGSGQEPPSSRIKRGFCPARLANGGLVAAHLHLPQLPILGQDANVRL